MPKTDKAHEWTDEELKKLERRITRIYREARDELQETIDKYFESFAKRDEEMKALIGTTQNGKEWTEQDYKQWRLAQIGRGKRFEALRDKIAERMTKANEIAVALANGDIAKIYAMNRNYAIETAKEQAGDALVGEDFIQWDEETVNRLLVDEPDLMPYYPAERAVKRGIDLAWGKRQITANVTSGILQGKSIGKIASDLQRDIPEMNRTSAVRAARTAVTRAENAGRQDAADDLEKRGVILEKEWIAIIDGRTRHAHRRADGQRVENDEPFIVGGEKLMFPGDDSMGASGWNIYNCRCTRAVHVKGFKSILTEKQRKKANIRVVRS